MLIFPGSPRNDLLLWGKGTINTCSFCAIILKLGLRSCRIPGCILLPIFPSTLSVFDRKARRSGGWTYLICLYTIIVSRPLPYLISNVELTNRHGVAWLCFERGVREERMSSLANKIFLITIKPGLLWAARDCIIHDFLWPAIDQPALSAWAFG